MAIYYPPPPPIVAAGAAQPYAPVRSAVVPTLWTRDLLCPGPPVRLYVLVAQWVPPPPLPPRGGPIPIVPPPPVNNPPFARQLLPPGVVASWEPGPPRPEPIRARPAFFLSRNIHGVTRDLNGSPLGGCTVKCYDSNTDAVVFTVISDANGNYGGIVPGSGAYYLVAYKPAAPHVAGTSVNTLVGS